MRWAQRFSVLSHGRLFRWPLLGLLLAVVVVVAAGITRKIRFAGPRWVPYISLGDHKRRSARHWLITPPQAGKGSLPAVAVWVIVGLVVAGGVVFIWRWLADRRRGSEVNAWSAARGTVSGIGVEPDPVEAEPEVPTMRAGIEAALRSLDEDREPADAIVRAWLVLQEMAAGSGVLREESETPTEFTSRILRGALADDWAVRTLLALYLRARFGNQPVIREDVAMLRQAFQSLVETWRAPDSSAERAAFA